MTERTTEFHCSVEKGYAWNTPFNASKLDLEIKLFDFYAESIAFRIKILISNVTLF